MRIFFADAARGVTGSQHVGKCLTVMGIRDVNVPILGEFARL